MKKINWKLINAAFWIEIILSYILPFKVVDDFQYMVGFPIPFLSVYDTKIGVNPLMSMALNPFGLLLNGVIIYLILSISVKKYCKFKHNNAYSDIQSKTIVSKK
ncbi:hypothetical protein [Sinanaerobacter sp. ZZT-01]|uniref:hypothetical protein n=1 Tax=Sinanaerobacter sp. ZZT-01 TaxID=3111540 RepID=UPI002D7788E9|nr:hypothetical protein [Sinanaerobacter sp. ZZT-01]WRR92469.1 hypothetical protein U5921_10440 [Sinanaerobacter sp. ZZT-01]